MTSDKTYCGYVAIIGIPNAGKSTLLNALMGQRLAIVSPKVQTTRTKLLGFLTDGNQQIIFVDTPGIFEPRDRLGKAMVKAAWQAGNEADLILLMIDVAKGKIGAASQEIIDGLVSKQQKFSLVLNKVDQLDRIKLLPLVEKLKDTPGLDQIFMISALKGDGVDAIKAHIVKNLPEGPFLFGSEDLTDRPLRWLAAEITREQLYHQLHDELPYALTVEPESWEERKDGSVRIEQSIVVQREGQKRIVIGERGAQIKQLGAKAREAISELLAGQTVHLFLNVKIKDDWAEKKSYYEDQGLDFKAE